MYLFTSKVLRATTACTFSTSQLPKVVREWCVLTTRSDHFWTLRCRKSARRCGAKHIWSKNAEITACSGHLWTLRCRKSCLLYTSDAADEEDSVDLGGRRIIKKVAQNPQFLTLLTWKCASRHNGLHFFDIEWPSDRPKVVRTPRVLTLFTSKCAWRHNGVHFFDIATSKSGPSMR